MDVDAELLRHVGLQGRSNPTVAGVPVAMCDPCALDGMESLVEEIDLQQTTVFCRWIHDEEAIEIGRSRFENRALPDALIE